MCLFKGNELIRRVMIDPRFNVFPTEARIGEHESAGLTPRRVTTKETPGGDTRLNRQLAVLYCQRLLWLSIRVIEKIVGLFALSASGLVSFG